MMDKDKSIKLFEQKTMSNVELVLNMLAETSTTEILQQEQIETFEANKEVAQKGGKVAKAARVQLKEITEKSVVISKNAKKLTALPSKSADEPQSYSNMESYYLNIADEFGLQLPQREEFQIDIAFVG